MPNDGTPFDDSLIQDILDKEATARLARTVEALEALAARRRSLAEKLEQNGALTDHIARVSELTDAWGKELADMMAGKTTGRQVARDLMPRWDEVFSDTSRDILANAVSDAGGPVLGGEARWIADAFDLPQGDIPREWEGTFGDLGWTSLWPRNPNKRPKEETATIEQAVMDPITTCFRPPYPFQNTTSLNSGVADMATSPSATPSSGTISLSSRTMALVIMGGGTDSTAMVGSDVSWPAGYDTLSVTADIDARSTLFAMAIVGGATASAQLVLRAILTDGRSFRGTLPLNSVIAPLIWGIERRVVDTFRVTLGGIALNGKAGSARLMAGAHDNTAAVGVAGSSGTYSLLSATITRICATVS
jgi:hypothetical protein